MNFFSVLSSCFQALSFSREAVGISLVTLYVKFAPNLSTASVEEYSTTLTVNNAVSSQEVTLQVDIANKLGTYLLFAFYKHAV